MFVLICIIIFLSTLAGLFLINENKNVNQQLSNLREELGKAKEESQERHKHLEEAHKMLATLDEELKASKEANSKIVSQKQSVLTRTGAMVENIVPLLNDLPYDPTNMHHLGKPVDFLYFNYDEPEPYIAFVEVKSGKAKESKRQKTIMNIIKENKVHYELLQITDKGIKITRKV